MNMLELTCHIFTAFSSASHADVVYTDFSKGFDIINHKLLVFIGHGISLTLIEMDKHYLGGFAKT